MKKVLILYPHWPPSNLAGVHRARLISNFLPEFDWKPVVITVHEDYYEEKLDPSIVNTVRPHTELIKVAARKVKSSNRLIGDIGLRSFASMKKEALNYIKNNKVDFLWIPIPSYYTSLIGRQIHELTNVPYGIDYIDPWVKPKDVVGSWYTKAGLSNILAKILEPYAVKKASLLSGVDFAYYAEVLRRNPKISPVTIGMPYGFDPNDHEIHLSEIETIWPKDEEALVYAGAFLPKSHLFLKTFFENVAILKQEKRWSDNLKIYFLGTGKYPGKKIIEYAKDFGLQSTVVEVPNRFPFLTILNFLSRAKGIVVLGSEERHYTASKIFQSLLSKRPVFAVFHHKSSVNTILEEAAASKYLVKYNADHADQLSADIRSSLLSFIKFDEWKPELKGLDKYSAKESARKLAEGMDLALKK